MKWSHHLIFDHLAKATDYEYDESKESGVLVMPKGMHLYFHSPCFDGIVSGLLVWDFLESAKGMKVVGLHTVDYEMRPSWLTSDLKQPCAVVDFLYHPQARFWADHHLTSFLSDEARRDYEKRKNDWLLYDATSGSCALLLCNHFRTVFAYHNPRYDSLIGWAERVDAARYRSVREAILGEHPALQVSRSLALSPGKAYSKFLLRSLRQMSLEEIIRLPDVARRIRQVDARIWKGLKLFELALRPPEDGIVSFDTRGIRTAQAIISRYAPYYFFPKARYSIGINPWKKDVKITAMRNPWREFESVFLGKIFEKFGGGGHQRVGSVILTGTHMKKAPQILESLICDIRDQESSTKGAPHGSKV